MRELEEEFERAGIAVHFVVIGTAEEAKAFATQFGDPSRVIPDPRKESHLAMGLPDYNFFQAFADKELGRRRKHNKTAGFHQNWRATKLEHAAQLPGAAVIDAKGLIRWLHRGKHPGDLPHMAEMHSHAKRALGLG